MTVERERFMTDAEIGRSIEAITKSALPGNVKRAELRPLYAEQERRRNKRASKGVAQP